MHISLYKPLQPTVTHKTRFCIGQHKHLCACTEEPDSTFTPHLLWLRVHQLTTGVQTDSACMLMAPKEPKGFCDEHFSLLIRQGLGAQGGNDHGTNDRGFGKFQPGSKG